MIRSKSKSIFISLLILVSISFATTGSSGGGILKYHKSDSVKPVDNSLIVDIHEFKPLILNENGYRGHDIDLWDQISKDLKMAEGDDFRYNFVDAFREVMPRLKELKADVSLGGITITADREEDADFIPYMRSGAGILITKEIGFFNKLWLNIVFYAKLFVELIPFFLTWACYVCFWALIIWRLEIGNKDFNDKLGEGFADSRFFVHVVISSTGFGNQIPMSKWGRRVAVILMYSGIGFMFPLITGKITTEMSEKNLTYISCKEDLHGKKVAVKNGTVTANSITLLNLGAELVSVPNVADGVQLLRMGNVDAVVHDKPALEYVAKDDPELAVVDELFDIQIYGIALKQGSPLREKISRLVLEYEESGFMDELSIKWLGSTGD